MVGMFTLLLYNANNCVRSKTIDLLVIKYILTRYFT